MTEYLILCKANTIHSIGKSGFSYTASWFYKNKILFYDVIYKPNQTQFLKDAKKNDNNIENGLMMFLYQAQLAFKIWNNILPEIDEEIIRILKKWKKL